MQRRLMRTTRRLGRQLAWAGCLVGGGTLAAVAGPTSDQLAFFEAKIRPVLAQHCYFSTTVQTVMGGPSS